MMAMIKQYCDASQKIGNYQIRSEKLFFSQIRSAKLDKKFTYCTLYTQEHKHYNLIT